MRVEGQCHCGANVDLISLKVHNIKLLEARKILM